MRLELGGGRTPTAGYVNVDSVHGVGDLRRRAQDGPLPFVDDSVEAARCAHLMEHIPAGLERIFVFNEVHRVLRPGATFEVIVPLFPSWGAIADPGHVSYWVRESFDYFTGRLGTGDGIARWDLVAWSTRQKPWGTEGHAILRKPRP